MDPGSEKSQGVLSAGELLGVQGVGGERYMLGLGISPIRKGVGLVQEGGGTRTPFGLLALSQSSSLSAGPAPLDSLLLVPVRVLFSPSLSLHYSHHSAWPIEQNQPLCPFRSVSAQHRLHLHRRLSLVSPAKSPTSTSRTPPKKRALGPCCCPCEPAKFHIVDRSPPGKTVPCPSSSPQATFLCFETQPSKHRPSSAILGSPTDDDAPSAAAPPSLCSRCPPP